MSSQPVAPGNRATSIRPAALDDLPRLAEIETRVHVAPWNEGHFQGEIEKEYSRIWVLTDDETDEQIFGYIVFWNLLDACEILNVAVDLPYRGLGFAKHLVRRAVSDATRLGLKKSILDVRKGNLAAIQLYQGLGFAITQMRKGFYGNGEDAYQMTLELEGPPQEF